jgi:DNA-binding response OmpR family regulator
MGLPQNILIVEDEVITQRYMQDIFAQHDITVVGCFNNAKDTLENLKNIECDMILMDINIKGSMDGIQLARQILEQYTLPIVFITAHSDDATLDELLDLAPYGFIGKPFSSKELITTLKIAYKRYLTHLSVQHKHDTMENTDIIINEKYRYSKNKSELFAFDDVIKLNQKQCKLLDLLVINANHTVHFDIIIAYVWGSEPLADSALRTLVYSIRKVLPDLPIVSHSKMGYTLVCK